MLSKWGMVGAIIIFAMASTVAGEHVALPSVDECNATVQLDPQGYTMWGWQSKAFDMNHCVGQKVDMLAKWLNVRLSEGVPYTENTDPCQMPQKDPRGYTIWGWGSVNLESDSCIAQKLDSIAEWLNDRLPPGSNTVPVDIAAEPREEGVEMRESLQWPVWLHFGLSKSRNRGEGLVAEHDMLAVVVTSFVAGFAGCLAAVVSAKRFGLIETAKPLKPLAESLITA